MTSTSHIDISFSDDSLLALNMSLAFIMFGIALGIQISDFQGVWKMPRSAATGVISQFILLPMVTFLLIWILNPDPAIALGMILVAACPGGNVSNFISSISKANIALSVSLTAIATLLCPIFTPLNFKIWAGILPSTAAMLQTFNIAFSDMLSTVLLVLILPLVAGMLLRAKATKLASKIEKPVRWMSFFILMAFIGIALKNNFLAFKMHLAAVFVLVLLHNAAAFALGYFSGKVVKLPITDCRSIAIETGIQNSGLGLIIIFTFFEGNGGMALVAAWWGIWHIVAGLVIARIFRWQSLRMVKVPLAN